MMWCCGGHAKNYAGVEPRKSCNETSTNLAEDANYDDESQQFASKESDGTV
jgi:hypothetical protein